VGQGNYSELQTGLIDLIRDSSISVNLSCKSQDLKLKLKPGTLHTILQETGTTSHNFLVHLRFRVFRIALFFVASGCLCRSPASSVHCSYRSSTVVLYIRPMLSRTKNDSKVCFSSSSASASDLFLFPSLGPGPVPESQSPYHFVSPASPHHAKP
jgi:hypothetical protein